MNIYLSVRCIYYREHRGEILSFQETVNLLSVGYLKPSFWLLLVESHSVGRGEDSVPIPLSV